MGGGVVFSKGGWIKPISIKNSSPDLQLLKCLCPTEYRYMHINKTPGTKKALSHTNKTGR